MLQDEVEWEQLTIEWQRRGDDVLFGYMEFQIIRKHWVKVGKEELNETKSGVSKKLPLSTIWDKTVMEENRQDKNSSKIS